MAGQLKPVELYFIGTCKSPLLLVMILWSTYAICSSSNKFGTGGAKENANEKACEAMSSARGKCVPLDDCTLYEDVRTSLLNGTEPPYYFNALHDYDACGAPNGPETLICCDTESLEDRPNKNVLRPPYCGVQSVVLTRIVGGMGVLKPGTYPWLAELKYISKSQEKMWMCGGALITDRHILTAAHCTLPNRYALYKARIGGLNLDADESFAQERLVKDVRVHEGYNPHTKVNDVAVVLLQEKIVFTSTVHPICLPYLEAMKKETYEHDYSFVAGWGKTEYEGKSSKELLHTQLEVLPNSECHEKLQPHNINITQKHLCAGMGDGVHDTCRGDSGMPLMQPINLFYYVIGVTSFGYYCAVKGYPTVSARVTEYIDWIVEKIDD